MTVVSRHINIVDANPSSGSGGGGSSITVLNENDFASNDSANPPSQASTKEYIRRSLAPDNEFMLTGQMHENYSAFGQDVKTANSLWYQPILLPSREILYPMGNSNFVRIYNPHSNTYRDVSKGATYNTEAGTYSPQNRCVYLAPRSGSNVVKIDIVTEEVSIIPIGFSTSTNDSYRNVTLSLDNKVIMIPDGSDTSGSTLPFLVLDTLTDVITSHTKPFNNDYGQPAITKNNEVFVTSYTNSAQCLLFNPNTGTFTTIDLTNDPVSGLSTGISTASRLSNSVANFDRNKIIILPLAGTIPYYATYNVDTGEIIRVSLSGYPNTHPSQYGYGFLNQNGKIYVNNQVTNLTLFIDPEDDTYEFIDFGFGTRLYFGTIGMDGNIYTQQFDGTNIVKVNLKNTGTYYPLNQILHPSRY